MPNIRLVALDLDGTLLNSEKRISPRNLAALEALAARGILMVPITGRPFQGLPSCVLDLPGLRYTVTSNGATIRDLEKNAILLERHLSASTALAVLDACREVSMIREVFRDGVGYLSLADRDALCQRYAGDPAMRRYVLDSRQVLPGSVEDFLRQSGAPVEELFFLTDSVEEKQRLRQRLAPLPDIAFADPFPRDLEVIAWGIDKGESLRWLLERLQLSPQEVLAMGDRASVISMLQLAGIGVAPANADPEVKEAAGFISPASCDEDAVALALERFVLNEA